MVDILLPLTSMQRNKRLLVFHWANGNFHSLINIKVDPGFQTKKGVPQKHFASQILLVISDDQKSTNPKKKVDVESNSLGDFRVFLFFLHIYLIFVKNGPKYTHCHTFFVFVFCTFTRSEIMQSIMFAFFSRTGQTMHMSCLHIKRYFCPGLSTHSFQFTCSIQV